MATIQLNFRHLFSEYLHLLENILSLPQTPDTLKLLNETFVGNDTWLETVKNYSISMWLQDVVSPVVVALYNSLNSEPTPDLPSLSLDEKYIIFENLESLRGINLLNFKESSFFRQVEYIHNQSNMLLPFEDSKRTHQFKTLKILPMAQDQVKFLFIQCNRILEYHNQVLVFFKQAQDMYFPVINQHKETQKANKENQGNIMNSFMNPGCTRNMRNNTYDSNTRNHPNQFDSFYL